MKELTCICCPRGCQLKVDENNNFAVTGNSCPRGAAYGYAEMTAPVRVVTATAAIDGSFCSRCPVKTEAPVPKDRVFDVVKSLSDLHLHAPVACGQVVLADAAGTGINVVATRNMSVFPA